MKNQISGLKAARCSSALINVNSYTQGKEMSSTNADWFQALIWKTADLEAAAAAGEERSQPERASAVVVRLRTRTGQGGSSGHCLLCTAPARWLNWRLLQATHRILGLLEICKFCSGGFLYHFNFPFKNSSGCPVTVSSTL